MVDLKAKPYCLNDEEIRWVEDTIASMTMDEKLSQLFVLLKPVPGADEEQIRTLMEKNHPGGMRWQGGDKETVYQQNTFFQRYSPEHVSSNILPWKSPLPCLVAITSFLPAVLRVIKLSLVLRLYRVGVAQHIIVRLI